MVIKMVKETLDGSQTVRYSKKQMALLKKMLGLDDDSKVFRACMNFTYNVTHTMFGGNLQDVFKRNKKNEDQELFNMMLDKTKFVLQKKEDL